MIDIKHNVLLDKGKMFHPTRKHRLPWGSEDLCFWCQNVSGCTDFEKIKGLRTYAPVFVPGCNFKCTE